MTDRKTDETVALASDHRGVALRRALAEELSDRGLTVVDLGADGEDSVDYPDFADALATALDNGRAGWGVLVCGTGIGISIAANSSGSLSSNDSVNSRSNPTKPEDALTCDMKSFVLIR